MEKDSRFSSAASEIRYTIRRGKSDNSNKMYDSYFKKFQNWCLKHSVSHLPATMSTVAVFLSSLVQESVSESVLSAYFYSIKWYHDLNVCVNNPWNSKLLHDLLCVRVCAMFLIGFAGFFRYNELANLRVRNISFHEMYLSVHIESSKTDVYRRGNDVLIASTGKSTCPVYWTFYLQLAELSDKPNNFIFRSIRYLKSQKSHKLFVINKP